MHDDFGNRMKKYENVSKHSLMNNTPVIIRLDGCHFHTFCKKLQRPFDRVLRDTMNDTLKALCENITGCVFGYTQSDEISLVLIDYQTTKTQPWFDNETNKIISVSASLATLYFNKFFKENTFKYYNEAINDKDVNINDIEKMLKIYESKYDIAYFDARAFNIPKEEVLNCILWRQQDATRNSIQQVAHCYFSQKELHKKKTNEIQDMLMEKYNINWNNYPIEYKRGVACIKQDVEIKRNEEIIVRKKWVIDKEMPILSQDKDYLERFL